jgi:serine/threonine-protein kinase
MALRKEADRRYLSAAQLGEDTERWLAGRPVIARPDSVGYRFSRFVARNRGLVAAGAALALLLVAFGVTATVAAGRFARARDRAEQERVAADDVLAILTGLFERADPNKYPGGDTVRVTALLDDAEREVERLSDDPARQSALWRAVGRMRGARGESQRAIELFTRAYQRRRALFGPDDVEAARIHHEIATAMFAHQGAVAARPILDSSLAELRRLLGEEHEDVRAALGDLLMATTDSVAARVLLDRLLTLEQRSPSRDPVAMANRLDTQGAARYAAGRYDEAAAMFEASLALLEKQLPPTHQYIRTERRNLALALVGQGLVARAESLQRVALEIEDRIPGPAAARAMAREALALTLARAGREDSAVRYEREALALFREGMAAGHWRIWSAERNLAFMVAALGRVEEGLALLDSAIALATLGADAGESVAYLTAQRVPFLLRLDRAAEASRSLAAAERGLGASPSVSAAHRAHVHRYAGMIALAAADAPRAADRFRQAVALVEPPGDSATVPGVNSCLLGVALARLGRMAEARGLLDGACATYQAQGPADPLIVEWIRAARARARSERRRRSRPSKTASAHGIRHFPEGDRGSR